MDGQGQSIPQGRDRQTSPLAMTIKAERAMLMRAIPAVVDLC
jgi:hypothetical protein